VKLLSLSLCMTALLFTPTLWALNVCTMTFNSPDEKQAMQSAYASDSSTTFTELVPNSNDPHWLKKACQAQIKCDVLLISGHFGGLFFGEKTIPTLSIDDMFQQSCDAGCPGIFENIKSVYLMGCNTLASKKADHRSIDEYLRVLVNDGFPLENAEMVASARYAHFGESIENKMRMLFPKAQVIFGFDSTGPKGATAGPLLKKALHMSSASDRATIGASPEALNSVFKRLNARVTTGDKASQKGRDLRCALASEKPSVETIRQAFTADNVRSNFDAALEMKNTGALAQHLAVNSDISKEFYKVGTDILKQSASMLGLQKKVYDLFLKLRVIPDDVHQRLSTQAFENFLSGGLDYIRTEQLCYMAENTPQLPLDPNWNLGPANFKTFNGVLASCFKDPRGTSFKNIQITGKTTVEKCLMASNGSVDWFCLTKTPLELDMNACLFAAARNPDLENADNMRWYCWDRLREQMRISPSQCLALSKSFDILGNRIKSNWNCLNAIR
jgi:hypothetical protein